MSEDLNKRLEVGPLDKHYRDDKRGYILPHAPRQQPHGRRPGKRRMMLALRRHFDLHGGNAPTWAEMKAMSHGEVLQHFEALVGPIKPRGPKVRVVENKENGKMQRVEEKVNPNAQTMPTWGGQGNAGKKNEIPIDAMIERGRRLRAHHGTENMQRNEDVVPMSRVPEHHGVVNNEVKPKNMPQAEWDALPSNHKMNERERGDRAGRLPGQRGKGDYVNPGSNVGAPKPAQKPEQKPAEAPSSASHQVDHQGNVSENPNAAARHKTDLNAPTQDEVNALRLDIQAFGHANIEHQGAADGMDEHLNPIPTDEAALQRAIGQNRRAERAAHQMADRVDSASDKKAFSELGALHGRVADILDRAAGARSKPRPEEDKGNTTPPPHKPPVAVEEPKRLKVNGPAGKEYADGPHGPQRVGEGGLKVRPKDGSGLNPPQELRRMTPSEVEAMKNPPAQLPYRPKDGSPVIGTPEYNASQDKKYAEKLRDMPQSEVDRLSPRDKERRDKMLAQHGTGAEVASMLRRIDAKGKLTDEHGPKRVREGDNAQTPASEATPRPSQVASDNLSNVIAQLQERKKKKDEAAAAAAAAPKPEDHPKRYIADMALNRIGGQAGAAKKMREKVDRIVAGIDNGDIGAIKEAQKELENKANQEEHLGGALSHEDAVLQDKEAARLRDLADKLKYRTIAPGVLDQVKHELTNPVKAAESQAARGGNLARMARRNNPSAFHPNEVTNAENAAGIPKGKEPRLKNPIPANALPPSERGSSLQNPTPPDVSAPNPELAPQLPQKGPRLPKRPDTAALQALPTADAVHFHDFKQTEAQIAAGMAAAKAGNNRLQIAGRHLDAVAFNDNKNNVPNTHQAALNAADYALKGLNDAGMKKMTPAEKARWHANLVQRYNIRRNGKPDGGTEELARAREILRHEKQGGVNQINPVPQGETTPAGNGGPPKSPPPGPHDNGETAERRPATPPNELSRPDATLGHKSGDSVGNMAVDEVRANMDDMSLNLKDAIAMEKELLDPNNNDNAAQRHQANIKRKFGAAGLKKYRDKLDGLEVGALFGGQLKPKPAEPKAPAPFDTAARDKIFAQPQGSAAPASPKPEGTMTAARRLPVSDQLAVRDMQQGPNTAAAQRIAHRKDPGPGLNWAVRRENAQLALDEHVATNGPNIGHLGENAKIKEAKKWAEQAIGQEFDAAQIDGLKKMPAKQDYHANKHAELVDELKNRALVRLNQGPKLRGGKPQVGQKVKGKEIVHQENARGAGRLKPNLSPEERARIKGENVPASASDGTGLPAVAQNNRAASVAQRIVSRLKMPARALKGNRDAKEIKKMLEHLGHGTPVGKPVHLGNGINGPVFKQDFVDKDGNLMSGVIKMDFQGANQEALAWNLWNAYGANHIAMAVNLRDFKPVDNPDIKRRLANKGPSAGKMAAIMELAPGKDLADFQNDVNMGGRDALVYAQTEKYRQEGHGEAEAGKLAERDVALLGLGDYLNANNDRHGGNVKVHPTKGFKAIDNGYIGNGGHSSLTPRLSRTVQDTRNVVNNKYQVKVDHELIDVLRGVTRDQLKEMVGILNGQFDQGGRKYDQNEMADGVWNRMQYVIKNGHYQFS
jgi:hypothetical protein